MTPLRNFSENSSVLEVRGFPKGPFLIVLLLRSLEKRQHTYCFKSVFLLWNYELTLMKNVMFIGYRFVTS